jgi:hypothetical protein
MAREFVLVCGDFYKAACAKLSNHKKKDLTNPASHTVLDQR